MKNLSIDLKHNFLFIYTSRHYDTESYEKKKRKTFYYTNFHTRYECSLREESDHMMHVTIASYIKNTLVITDLMQNIRIDYFCVYGLYQ